MKVNSRKVILELLNEVDQDRFSNKLIQELQLRDDLDHRDKAFISKILYGVVENRMYLDYNKKDEWGLPTITFDAAFGDNEIAMRKDMKEQAIKMLKTAGFKDVKGYDNSKGAAMGLGIHEMGTARMGRDPKTSVLNQHNQVHACKNVYVTDGAFMTSAGCQNPSLTYMAFTARAVNHAASELKKSNS